MARELIAREVAELEALEASLEALETADRAEAQARALILSDGPTARLFLRYHAEARMAFHRAHSALIKTLEQDACEEESPNVRVHVPGPRFCPGRFTRNDLHFITIQ